MSEKETATTAAAAKKPQLMQRIRGLLMFIDLPIKQKFLLFGGSTLLWFCLMASVTVVSLTALHYEYYQISRHIIPYRQTINTVLGQLNEFDLTLRQIHNLTVSQDSSAFAATRKQLVAIRNALTELSIQQTSETNDSTIIERILQNMAKSNQDGLHYLQKSLSLTDQLDRSLDDFLQKKRTALQNRSVAPNEATTAAYQTVLALSTETAELSRSHLEWITARYKTINQNIYANIRNSVHTVLALLLIASLLLALFTHYIIAAFHRPIKTITHQIESLSSGDIDLAKKVSITSQDEIGTLSWNFNNLMEAVHSMTIYKKVIEEDSTLEEVYHRLGEVFNNDIGIQQYTIFEVNTQQKEMRAVYPPLVGDARLYCHEEIFSDCTLCRAVKTGHNISSFQFNGICRYFKPEGTLGHVCIPMMLGGNTGGVVQLRFSGDGQNSSLSGKDQTRLFKAENYINQSLSVLEAKRLMQTLRDSALVDPLTGLYNRRFLQEHTKQIINGVMRRNKQIGLLVCDLDYFKQVNDTHGHDIGDQMLKETASILKSSVREADLVIRFGGEEFLVLLLDLEPGMAVGVAEKIRAKMEQFKLPVGDSVLQKSISIGVSEFPHDTDGFWQAIKYADVALYQAKETGRNRVVRFAPDMWAHGDF